MLTKEAHLKTLDLTIPLTWRQSYADDGYVSDLTEYLLGRRLDHNPTITPEIRRAWAQKYNHDYKGLAGVTLKIKKAKLFRDEEETRIAYLNLGDDLANSYVRGRQETDALQELGQLKRLEAILNAKCGLSFLGVRPERVVDTGGVYALLKRQYSPKEIAKYAPKKMNDRMTQRMKDALFGLLQASRQAGHKEMPDF